jgi:hypothetical protein
MSRHLNMNYSTLIGELLSHGDSDMSDVVSSDFERLQRLEEEKKKLSAVNDVLRSQPYKRILVLEVTVIFLHTLKFMYINQSIEGSQLRRKFKTNLFFLRTFINFIVLTTGSNFVHSFADGFVMNNHSSCKVVRENAKDLKKTLLLLFTKKMLKSK